MNERIIFNGRSSEDFGLRVVCDNPFQTAERAVERYQISGRNGELIQDLGYYLNRTVTFRVAAYGLTQDAVDLTAQLAAWLQPDADYHRLEETYNPDVFHMARITSINPTQIGYLYKNIEFELAFDCMPQKFLKRGEATVEFSASAQGWKKLVNPTPRTALPLIRFAHTITQGVTDPETVINFYGRGRETYIKCLANTPEREIEVDTETETARFTDTGADAGQYIIFAGMPSLIAGQNDMLTPMAVSMTPRWWRL